MSALSTCAARHAGWPLQRILFLLAGAFTLAGVVLAAVVSAWFLLLPALVGVNQLLMVAAGWCPASLVLTRLGARDLRADGAVSR
jgi:hypothetical protein